MADDPRLPPRPKIPGEAECRALTCRARIRYVETDTGSDALMPLDWEPHPDGNIVPVWPEGRRYPIAHVLKKDETPPAGTERFMPHWQSCPAAKSFRKEKD